MQKLFILSIGMLALCAAPLLMAQTLDGSHLRAHLPIRLSDTPQNSLFADGQIVGSYTDASYKGSYNGHGFLDCNGIFSTIDFPGAVGTVASGINDGGQIVGWYETPDFNYHGFLDDNNNLSTIDFPGAPNGTSASGINDGGQIVGSYYDASDDQHGFLDDDNSFSTIDFPGAIQTVAFEINDGGQIVGYYTDTSGNDHGFLDDNGSFSTIDFPGAVGTGAAGINTFGQIVGYYYDASYNGHGFLDDNGSFSTIDFPGAVGTGASGINDGGQIVGFYYDASGKNYGFLYNGNSFSTINFPGNTNMDPSGINNYGCYGVSGGNANDKCNGQCSGGTLGSMVILGSQQFILSNNHILGLPTSGSDTDKYKKGAPVTRPGLSVNQCRTGQIVGNLAKAPTLSTGVDAAIATAIPGKISPSGEIAGIGIPAGETEPAFDGMAVAKSGATTGLTCGVVMSTDMRLTLPYGHCGSQFPVTFDNQIVVRSPTSPFSCPGDSGSLIVDSNTSQPVALLIGGVAPPHGGGCPQGSISIGNPIDTVLEKLGGVYFAPNPVHTVSACMGPGGLGAGVSSQSMPESERQRAMQAKEANARRLMENPAVLGVGSGSQADDPSQSALIIFVRKGVSAEFIPDEIDGVRTRIIYTEPFTTGSCAADAQPEEAGFGVTNASPPAVATRIASDVPIMPGKLVVPSFDGSIDTYVDELTLLIRDISGYFAP